MKQIQIPSYMIRRTYYSNFQLTHMSDNPCQAKKQWPISQLKMYTPTKSTPYIYIYMRVCVCVKESISIHETTDLMGKITNSLPNITPTAIAKTKSTSTSVMESLNRGNQSSNMTHLQTNSTNLSLSFLY